MMWAWSLLRERGRRWCSLPMHFSFDFKNVAQLVLRAEPSCLPPCVLHKLFCINNTSCINKSTCNCCSVTQLCLTHCEPTDCSTPGLPVHHQLQELAQTHVHWVSDAVQPSHPLSPLLLLSSVLHWHQGFFQWADSLHQVVKLLKIQLQLMSFQCIFRVDLL